jgi:Fic family protein
LSNIVSLQRSQIINITKVNPTTATKDLKTLCKEGFIERKTPTSSPNTYYFEIQKNK